MRNLLLPPQNSTRYRYLFIVWLICVLVDISFIVLAQTPSNVVDNGYESTNGVISQQIKAQLVIGKKKLNYPKSVERFYDEKGYVLVWLATEKPNAQVLPAMVLLDCVSQFGLNNQDFHPNELRYKKLTALTEHPSLLSEQRANFDVLLTDAMITFINQLHYGKFNEDLTPSKIDAGDLGNINAVECLSMLMTSRDFYTEIIKVQPNLKEYHDLQRYMRLVRGQYLEDNYEFPEESVRKMALNMERLRWMSVSEGTNLVINIPAYKAKLMVMDTTYFFKVMVGNPLTPTPLLESAITHFTVAPDVKVSAKKFINILLPSAIKNIDYLEKNHYTIYDSKGRFVELTGKKLAFIKAHASSYFARRSVGGEKTAGKIEFGTDISTGTRLYGSPQSKLFLLSKRAVTEGGIGIEQIEKLAGLLSDQDGTTSKTSVMHKSIAAYQRKNFILKTPVPVKTVYLTCEMIDSHLIIYDDIYAQDKSLELAMYGFEPVLALDKKLIKKL
ncbi:murein L,D-transpeptidase YcbB/YkuD [Pedobacter sp. UYEF25]